MSHHNERHVTAGVVASLGLAKRSGPAQITSCAGIVL